MQLDPHTCGKPQIHKGQSEHRGEVLSSMRARAVFLEEEPRELSLKEQAGVGLARYRGSIKVRRGKVNCFPACTTPFKNNAVQASHMKNGK